MSFFAKTQFIAHRVNTVEELLKVPHHLGVEIDLRPFGQKLVLQHDPFMDGENFEDFLRHYQHQTLILNVKSERVELKILELLEKHLPCFQNYFFLDSSFPMIYTLSQKGIKNLALRFSEFEGLDTLEKMKGRVDWVWVDCFTRLPLDKEVYQRIKELKYKLCLVSPELQNHPEKLTTYRTYLQKNGLAFDAICTKIYKIKEWTDAIG